MNPHIKTGLHIFTNCINNEGHLIQEKIHENWIPIEYLKEYTQKHWCEADHELLLELLTQEDETTP